MPNFGKVFCFMKFNVNSLNLQEVLAFGIKVKEITSIHNSRRLQKKAKNPSLPCILFFSIFHRSGHFLFSSFEKPIACPETIMVMLSTHNSKLGSRGGPFLTKVVNF
jgi:hypothetical protein